MITLLHIQINTLPCTAIILLLLNQMSLHIPHWKWSICQLALKKKKFPLNYASTEESDQFHCWLKCTLHYERFPYHTVLCLTCPFGCNTIRREHVVTALCLSQSFQIQPLSTIFLFIVPQRIPALFGVLPV